MYKAKHVNSKAGKLKKTLVLMASLVLLVTVAVSATLAYLMDDSGEPITNTFQPSEVTTRVDETFKNNEKTNVTIANTGDVQAYIRAKVVVTWQNAAGEAYGIAPADTDYAITYNPDGGWDKGADGFWYWKTPVDAGRSTGKLIGSCSPAGNAPAEGYYLCVEILSSGIQSQPTKVVTEKWSSGVSGLESDGTTLIIN